MKIAISGPMGSGKSTIANIIKKFNSEYEIYSFGGKIKGIAYDLFQMDKNFKDRSLLINIADRMRDIDPDVWAKYIINDIGDHKYCIIDDLRFQNELDILQKDSEWIYIVLHIDEKTRLNRLKELYPDNYEDHVKNMSHLSEQGKLKFYNYSRILHVNSDDSLEEIKFNIEYFINKFKYD
jgi:cytidylate kinase